MLGLVLRVLLSLAVVLGLFWMVARTGSRKLGGRDRSLIRVRGRQALSRGSSLAVVEVGSRVLVVGVSDGGVRLLTEMDPGELGANGTPQVAAAAELAQPDTAAEAAPDEDFQAAYERASAGLTTHTSVAAAGEPARAGAAPAPAHRLEGPLAGSLLSASTWRLAWSTAVGRGDRTQPGDAA